MAILIPCLDELFDEFDQLAPDRDTASDGWVGDSAHADRTSDHNPDESGAVPIHDADSVDEVHAIDVDDTLRCDGDPSMEDCVQVILKRCRDGREHRLRYIIYERRIWEQSNDWREEYYSGSNAHDQHAHFSASYDTDHEASRAPWGLVEEFMALSGDDKKWIEQTIQKYVGDVVDRWDAEGDRVPENDPNPTMTVAAALFYIGSMTSWIRNCGGLPVESPPAAE